LVEIVREYTVS